MHNRLDTLNLAIKNAAAAIQKVSAQSGIVEKKGRGNFVTAVDVASEKAIIETIKKYHPSDTILSEETASDIVYDSIPAIPHLWIADPIDGTNNLRFDRNYSAISLAYAHHGVVQFGIAHDPFRDETFFAHKGKGAYLNDKPIHVGSEANLEKAIIGTDNSYKPTGTRRNLEIILKLPVTPWTLMKGASVNSMCDVATGRIDLYFQTCVKPWDNAAAFLIVEEAGGVVRGFDGNPVPFWTNSPIAGNATLVKQFVSALKNE